MGLAQAFCIHVAFYPLPLPPPTIPTSTAMSAWWQLNLVRVLNVRAWRLLLFSFFIYPEHSRMCMHFAHNKTAICAALHHSARTQSSPRWVRAKPERRFNPELYIYSADSPLLQTALFPVRLFGLHSPSIQSTESCGLSRPALMSEENWTLFVLLRLASAASSSWIILCVRQTSGFTSRNGGFSRQDQDQI